MDKEQFNNAFRRLGNGIQTEDVVKLRDRMYELFYPEVKPTEQEKPIEKNERAKK